MKLKVLPILFVAGLTGFAACRKANQDPVTGNWREVKLRIYQVVNGAIKYDTTYYAPFTNFDYIKFNNNGTGDIGSDYYYYPNSPGYPKVAQSTPPSSTTFSYTNTGSGYVLAQTPAVINFSGFITTDTVFVTGRDTLLQQAISYGPFADPANKSETESYYVR